MPAISPLAPAGFPDLKPIAGVRLAAYAAGVRYAGRNDVMLAELVPGTTIAGVLTQSKTPGAPVTPVLGILSCMYLMLGLPWITWVRFAVWLLIGMFVYFSYGFRRSRLLR